MNAGAGKTTLLDILAGRKKSGKVGGTVFVNGKPITSTFKRISE
jgi:ABC-type multidrug transport system ATPase subunit